MPAHTKYKRKYAKALKEGLREDGKSIAEVCSLWGISETCYHNWCKERPDFKEAHEQGDRDKKAWWFKLQRKVASGESAGNAAVINFALKNEAEYVDKQEVHNTHEEQIHTLVIKTLPSYTQGKVIEHDSTIGNLPHTESE